MAVGWLRRMPSAFPVTLDNCDAEPIHVPGRIQSHGALLAFDTAGVLRWASANAADLLGGRLPAIGQPLAVAHFDGNADVAAAIVGELGAMAEPGAAPRQHDVEVGGRPFHLLLHHAQALLVAEFEPRAAGAPVGAFAIQAHRGLDRLRRGRSVEELLEVAVQEVRRLTGFDRVMAYRFRHDASGDIVAEERDPALEPFLHRRYPAADIPAQARRLYVQNTLRLIADVRSQPVAVVGAGPEPLDMTHCVLRSVSPVHIEYLCNLQVGASMSVSVVIGGVLWGMIACHHGSARQVPYEVRMSCDVLAQVLAARVQSLLAAQHAQRLGAAATLRSRMVERLLVGDDVLSALSPSAGELAQALEAEAILMAEGGRIAVHGAVDEEQARPLLQWLESAAAPREAGLLALHARSDFPADVAAALGNFCGVLALRYDEVAAGWLVALRREQVETIAWGGRPEKHYVNGPLGPRLTPRGSFAEWRETVRDTAVPWSATDIEIGRHLLDELGRASAARHAELGRARNQMLAVLGHDLRTPLQTISVTSHILGRDAGTAKMGQRLQNATGRMQRLVGEVLDMSRLQSGLGLGFVLREIDVAQLVESLVDEVRATYTGLAVVLHAPPALHAEADPDRVAQLLGNLLSNARHHGAAGQAIVVELGREGEDAVLAVANPAPPIAPETVAQLFSPYKRQSMANARNKGGLGLGLYIAQEIARGHGGTLDYAWREPDVVFTLRWPLKQPVA